MTPSALPAGVFVSYSHADREWPRRFDVMLQPEVREGRLDVWVDTDVDAGDNWRSRIDAAIERASVALLLVSPDFLASRFIMNEELPALAGAGVRMVPVLLRHCLWDRVPVLTQVQWAHDPVRDGALATAHGSRRDEQIVRVCQRLLDLLPGARVGGRARAAASTPQPGPPAERSLILAEAPGRLYGVPPLPPGYLARDELADLRSRLVSAESGAVGVAGDVHALGLSGQGGIGKTVLAVALARDEDLARYFPDGIFWVDVGERADILALQLSLLGRFGAGTENLPRTVSEGVRALRSACEALRCLVVVDDAWSVEAAAAFRVTGPRGRLLYTSRDPVLLRAVSADVRPVGLLGPGAARLMLAAASGLPVEALPPEADRVLAGTGGVALALALAGAAVRGGTPWEEVIGGLERSARTYGVHPFANAFKALDTALRAVPSELADAYLTLAVFPAKAQVPLSVCQRYWQQMFGRSAGQASADLADLADRKLLNFDGETVSVHDLQHDYLLLQADDLARLHRELLLSFRRVLDHDGRWFGLPADEPYLWDALLKHLRGAELRDEVIATATDPAYIAARTYVRGVHAAESDLRRTAELNPMREDVSWLRDRFAQMSHLLSGLPSVHDVAVTLALHLADAPPPMDLTLLRPLLPRPCPSPVWGLAERSSRLLRAIEAHDGEVTALAWAPDGGTLATCGTDGVVNLWNSSTAEPRGILGGHRGTAWTAAFSPDGRVLVTGEDDGTVGLWDAVTREPLPTWGQAGRRTRALSFSPDGGLLVTGGEDGTLRLWDVIDRKPVWSARGHPGGVTDVCFGALGDTVASAGGSARLWRTDSGRPLRTVQPAGRWATTVRSTSDGRFVVGDTEGDVVVYDADLLRPVHAISGHKGGIWSLAVAPSDDVVAVGSGAGEVHLHGLDAERTQGAMGEHRRGVRSVRFSPDGRRLASGGADGRLCVWDTSSSEAYALPRHADEVEALAVGVHGTHLATTGPDHVVRIFDTVTRRVVATFRGHTDAVSSMAFSPSGEWLASAGADRTARIWRAGQPEQFRVLTAHTDAVSSVAFSPDGRRLATGGADRAVRIWEGPEWALLRTLHGHSGWVRAVTFSGEGVVLATAGSEGTIRLWDPASGLLRSTMSGHPGGTWALALRRHGSGLLSAGADGCVRLWHAGGDAAPEELWRASDPVGLLATSPDGNRFACAVDDDLGTVRLGTLGEDGGSVTLRLGTPVTSLSWGAAGLGVGTRGGGPLLLRYVDVDPPSSAGPD